MILLYLVLIIILFYIHKYTWLSQSKNLTYKIHVSLFKCFKQTHASLYPVKTF